MARPCFETTGDLSFHDMVLDTLLPGGTTGVWAWGGDFELGG